MSALAVRARENRPFPGGSETGATGLEPATSGVTGRVGYDDDTRRTSLNEFICRRLLSRGGLRSAQLSQSSNRRLSHEWATKILSLQTETRPGSRDIAGGVCVASAHELERRGDAFVRVREEAIALSRRRWVFLTFAALAPPHGLPRPPRRPPRGRHPAQPRHDRRGLRRLGAGPRPRLDPDHAGRRRLCRTRLDGCACRFRRGQRRGRADLPPVATPYDRKARTTRCGTRVLELQRPETAGVSASLHLRGAVALTSGATKTSTGRVRPRS